MAKSIRGHPVSFARASKTDGMTKLLNNGCPNKDEYNLYLLQIYEKIVDPVVILM
jgi:hypothetical protein